MSTAATDEAARTQSSLFDRRYLPFVVAAVALVTLGAFENRATSTILPTLARDLDGLALFGAASAAPLASYVVGVSLAGTWADRRGPLPVLTAGVLASAAAAAMAAGAPTMEAFVAVRFVAGAAEGLLDIGLTVLVASRIPAPLRPRLFSLYAGAWVLPSLVGPSLAGVVADHLHWRLVFLFAAVVMPPLLLVVRRPARRDAETDTREVADDPSRTTLGAAVVAAAAMAVISLGGGLARGHDTALPAGALVLAGVVVLTLTVRRLVPPGVLRAARGTPALIAVSALTAAAFGVPSAFLPLMLTTVHHLSAAGAGLSLTLTGVFWALGSSAVSRDAVQRRTTPASRLGLGLAMITVGVAGIALLALSLLPLSAGLALWAVAGTGMGIVSNTVSVTLLALAPAPRLGRLQAANGLLGTVASTVPVGLAGAAVAWFSPELPAGLFAAIAGLSAAFGGAGAGLARRVVAPR